MKNKNKLAVATFATSKYAYALPNFGRRLASAIVHSNIKKGTVICVTDNNPDMVDQFKSFVGNTLPEGWEMQLHQMDLDDTQLKNYKNDAQLLIAQMQGHALTEARKMNADLFWSVEADVLVPHNALSVSIDTLKFDDGYYDVAMVTYPSQGGGSFLGGRGTYQHQIAEDFLPEERDVPQELLDRSKEREEEFKSTNFRPSEDWIKEGQKIHEEIKKCPPKNDIWKTLGEHGWRKRGWMEYAYPAIGRGAILPTDWVGMGCTLLSKKALAMAHFDGYQGGGTQDLWLCWNHWNPEGMKMAVITHTLCDHVVRSREPEGEGQKFDKFVHVQAMHEPEGDYAGHLRQRHNPHYKHIGGEKYSPENDGMVARPPKPDEGESEFDKPEEVPKETKKPKSKT